MSTNDDRLFQLLPAIYRQRDEALGFPLRALLRVIAEQAGNVENDIAQLYDNWFIETCADWAVPYIGDLIGYRPVHEAGEPGSSGAREARLRNRILFPRREVANTIANRRRKGTIAVLETLASETAGWPARSIEFYRELGWTQNLNFLHPHRGRLLDLHDNHSLDLLETPFDRAAHTVDVVNRNIPSVGLFVWRLKNYPVTWTQANCVDNRPNCYTFSILGNDTPLFTAPQPEHEPYDVDNELEVPVPIRRRVFEVRDAHGNAWANPDYYGPQKSIEIRLGNGKGRAFTPTEIIPADLSHWHYQPPAGKVAVDPHLGRMAFHDELSTDVWVRYQYGFSADMGGGEYPRVVSDPRDATVLRVGAGQPFDTLSDAIKAAHAEKIAVIEITDSRLYEEQIRIHIPEGAQLQLRAASGARPVIQIPDRKSSRDALRVDLGKNSRLTLDGLLIAGRAVHIRGNNEEDCPPSVVIRHCTLVPGWSLDARCHPSDTEEPSLELRDTCARVRIEHSILGSIEVSQNEALTDPLPIRIVDSVVDATGPDIDAFSASAGCSFAYVTLSIARCTVIGHTHVHALKLAEDTIFHGDVRVARRQIGCVRFCYVPRGSRTPRRYECQPDLVIAAAAAADQDSEALRVRPQFNSTRYGMPEYCQLALDGAVEIAAGASDESEMGVFHDLFQPQRAANLQVRIQEYVPASADPEIIYAS